jgi:uncharacterized membrane protein
VGFSNVGAVHYATEWSGDNVIDLGGLPWSTESYAESINDAGKRWGIALLMASTTPRRSDGSVILGPGVAYSINDARQVVGSGPGGGATEWSGGNVISLGGLPGSTNSMAEGINDAGQVVGRSAFFVPEPSTWAMMLLGFAGLALAGYREQKQPRRSRVGGVGELDRRGVRGRLECLLGPGNHESGARGSRRIDGARTTI